MPRVNLSSASAAWFHSDSVAGLVWNAAVLLSPGSGAQRCCLLCYVMVRLAESGDALVSDQHFCCWLQAAALCYVPATKNYWVTGQHGNVQAFDPRAPGDVTPFIKATRLLSALPSASAPHPSSCPHCVACLLIAVTVLMMVN